MGSRSALASRLLKPNISVRVGASLFIAGAFCSVITMVAPHSQAADENGFYALALLELAIGLFAWFLPEARARDWSPFIFMVGGVIVVSGSLFFNGERHGGPATLTEIYYMWPALYAGYFLGRRGIIATLVLVGSAYAGTMTVVIADGPVALTRWVVTMSVVCGCAGALHALRLHVDGLLDQLRAAASTDHLTGMLNRRGFQEAFDLELERASRTGDGFALLLGDIDHFKALNDTHGHVAGDVALEAIGRVLREGCRGIDTAGRIGGEEFALLFPATRSADAYDAAERLRLSVGDLLGPDDRPLSISFGIVESPGHGVSWPDLMRAADHALYAAKDGGRNRTVAYAPSVVSVA